jgi:hypothetical protein
MILFRVVTFHVSIYDSEVLSVQNFDVGFFHVRNYLVTEVAGDPASTLSISS